MRTISIIGLLMCVACGSKRAPEPRYTPPPPSAYRFADLYTLRLSTINHYPLTREYALEAAEYMLTNPIDKSDKDWFYAADFITRWAKGTPNYDIAPSDIYHTIDAPITSEDYFILWVYVAAQVKLVLSNKGPPLSYDELQKAAARIMFDFCRDPKNKVEFTESFLKVRAAFDR